MPHRIYKMAFAKVYPALVAKAECKGRTRAEVDAIFRWLTGYTQEGFAAELAAGTTIEDFYACAPRLNPARTLVTGTVCGVRVEEVEDKTMRPIRILGSEAERSSPQVDELAEAKLTRRVNRKAMGKILREG